MEKWKCEYAYQELSTGLLIGGEMKQNINSQISDIQTNVTFSAVRTRTVNGGILLLTISFAVDSFWLCNIYDWVW